MSGVSDEFSFFCCTACENPAVVLSLKNICCKCKAVKMGRDPDVTLVGVKTSNRAWFSPVEAGNRNSK